MHLFKRVTASLLVVSTLALGAPINAQAAMVSTDTTLATPAMAAQRDRVNTFLMRDDVRKGLQDQGVSADAALERVKTMSDPEVAQLAGRIDQAPAGGEILGLLFTVFIVLLVTDILGVTKVFPFTRSIR
jgi:hypothetical protein